MLKIGRAIISCYDKTGVVELARLLREFDVEIISTAGTLKVLQEAGVEAMSIADFTGVRELLDGRVKSLHSKVHAGLLGVRDIQRHNEQLQSLEYKWIDMVVVNLRPVEALCSPPGTTPEEVMDQIDVGGVAMIRSAAKNYRYVTVVVNVGRYGAVMHELRAHEGSVTFATRCRLAQEAFACTAEYDTTIAKFLADIRPAEE